jgi:hypothetical protein
MRPRRQILKKTWYEFNKSCNFETILKKNRQTFTPKLLTQLTQKNCNKSVTQQVLPNSKSRVYQEFRIFFQFGYEVFHQIWSFQNNLESQDTKFDEKASYG